MLDMKSLNSARRRELRVAFSPRAQPVWFRVVQWTCVIIGGAVAFHGRSWFWCILVGLAFAGALLHFVDRGKTNAWTRPWGGWEDLTARRD
jgi:hypothetical protein